MRPSRDEMLMEIALAAAKRSTCSRASVGAVISREGRPLSLGYNGAPAGMPHCSHDCDCNRFGKQGLDALIHHAGYCNSLKPCTVSVHAEVNAISFAARHGVATDQAELHITYSPCLNCAMLIINAGITRVRWDQDYRVSHGVVLLQNAGIDVKLLTR